MTAETEVATSGTKAGREVEKRVAARDYNTRDICYSIPVLPVDLDIGHVL